jgi:hypothetical protein
MVIDVTIGDETISFIHYYHCVPKRGHALHSLFSHQIPHLSPTIILGDFNTHSPLWSPTNVSVSPWANAFESWLDEEGLSVLNPPGIPTWRGRDDQRPSTIDLVISNEAAILNTPISPISISFAESLGSDHAALTFTWLPTSAIPTAERVTLPGYALEDHLRPNWELRFKGIPPPAITDIPSLDSAANQLEHDINQVSSTLFNRRRSPDPRGVRWWNDECDAALSLVKIAKDEERRHAATNLRHTILAAKRSWAQEAFDRAQTSDLWSLARMRNGRRETHLSPLCIDGSLIQDPEQMANAFRHRFFLSAITNIDTSQPDDPPPLPPRPYIPISQEEVATALKNTANSSAPGISGINHKILKWAFNANPARFTTLFDACLRLGHHPWRSAKVVVIPKPNKPDYTLPKAYRPISLLECTAKLLEKIVARRLLSDVNSFSLIPTNQFGSRDYSSAVDAILATTHNAECCIKSNHVGALVLFDIQGYFDNISIPRLLRICADLGFPHEICAWLGSFLHDRNVHLSFNNFTSNPFSVDHGTPQGSPLSPIISAIFTSPLLKLTLASWKHRNLNMFVDDGSIFATGRTFKSATITAMSCFEEVLGWLHRNGLRADRDKTEFIIFSRRRSKHLGKPVTSVAVRDPTQGTYAVRTASVVRYLGVFLHKHHDWTHHAKVVANRARSTVRALSILGNSIRGINFASWRKIFHATIIPVLTYASPAWFTPSTTKKVLNILQVAQNDAIRKISGCFRTTPTLPLHHLVAILPIKFTLQKLRSAFGDRLLRLPPSSQLISLRLSNPAAYWRIELTPSTALTLFPTPQQHDFSFPFHPSQPMWSHERVAISYTKPTKQELKRTRHILSSRSSTFTLVLSLLPIPSPPFISCYVLLRGATVVDRGWQSGACVVEAMFKALLKGLSNHIYGHVSIFIPHRNVFPLLFRVLKHSFLPMSIRLTSILSDFLTVDALHSAEILWFSVKWAGRTLKAIWDAITAEAQPHVIPTPPSSHSAMAFAAWREEYPRRRGTAWRSCQPPSDSTPPPFIQGVLSRGNRRYFAAAIQITTGHAFDADYSDRFRPTAGDTTTCPCADSDAYASQDLPPRHTITHILTECPLHSCARARYLHNPSTPNEVLLDERGGRNLVDFLHYTQALLRPLPPRPDPP